MAGNFLQRSRHGTIFFFRRRVPRDVQHIIRLQQIYRSLGTADKREAIIRARAMAAHTDGIFKKLRMTKKKQDDDTLQTGYIIEADIDARGRTRAKFKTEPHDTLEDQARGLAEFKRLIQPSNADVGVSPGKPLGEAVAEFLKEGVNKPKTFRAYRTALNLHALPFFGADTPVSSIDQERFAKYVKHIFADQERAHSTKDGYVNAFTSLMSWLRARYPKSTPTLSTRKLIPAKEDADAEERHAFTLPHLRVLFTNAKRYRGNQPHKFWSTVAIAFMGCRIEELAQVHLKTDLRQDQESGVWYLELNEKVDPDGVRRKSMKKQSSKRVAPIHSALIRHGFLDYLSAQMQAGASRPFETGWRPWNEPSMGGVHWAHYIIRWGGRELEKLDKAGELSRDGLKLGYFHSMRHTFTNILVERDVSEERRAALQGQAVPGGGENAKRYAKMRHNPRLLSEMVEAHLGAYVTILDGVMAEG